MASNRRSSIGGRLRALIPFRRRASVAAQAAPVVSTKSLAVRPPWWRMAAQRLVGGLLPGFRSGSFPSEQTRAEPTYTPQRPLLARRIPLASKASVLRTAKDTVVGGSTEHLAMAPPPGVTESPAAMIQREAASIVVPPVQPLVRPEALTQKAEALTQKANTAVQRAATAASASGPVANSPGAISAAAHTLAAQMTANQMAAQLSTGGTPASAQAPPARGITATPNLAAASRAQAQSPIAGRNLTVAAPQGPSLPSQSFSAGLPLSVQRLAAAAYMATGQASSALPQYGGHQTETVPLFAARSAGGPMSMPDRPPASQLAAAAPEVAERPASPEQRWRAAVASVPLESPKPFPTSMRPLVAQLTGSADGASYTTGSATRRALAEVGALGATTGRVVHLAQQPSHDPAALGVLAHELTHARSPITRPRFMLHDHKGSMDSDERHARTVGSQFDTAAPMRVQRLFGGGGLPSVGGLTDQATGAMSSLGNQATGMVGGLANSATSAIGSGASEIGGMTERFSSAASGFANRMGEEAGSVSAGLVDSLPVGGGSSGVVGAVSQIARTVVDNAVREATQGAIGEANQAVSQMSQAAQGMVSQVQGMATNGVNNLAGQANQWVNGAMSQATGAVQDLGNQAMGAAGDAQNAVAGGLNQAMGAVGQVLGPGAQQALSGVDLDRIAEALEERLLRQLERRGGRYAGVF